METNEEFDNAVREIYPYHYFMIDDYKRGQLRKMFEAGKRQGMECAAEIAHIEMKDNGFGGDVRFGVKVVRDLIRKEIKP